MGEIINDRKFRGNQVLLAEDIIETLKLVWFVKFQDIKLLIKVLCPVFVIQPYLPKIRDNNPVTPVKFRRVEIRLFNRGIAFLPSALFLVEYGFCILQFNNSFC